MTSLCNCLCQVGVCQCRLIEAVGMSKLNQVKDSHAHAGNAAQDQQAALNNALPQSLTPVMPHPGLGPSASSEPPPWQHSSSSSAPASAPYPVSTLPLSALPPSLKAHQTSRDHRLPPRIALSPPILTPLHPPPGPQTDANELLSLAHQYGACIDRNAHLQQSDRPFYISKPRYHEASVQRHRKHPSSQDWKKPVRSATCFDAGSNSGCDSTWMWHLSTLFAAEKHVSDQHVSLSLSCSMQIDAQHCASPFSRCQHVCL